MVLAIKTIKVSAITLKLILKFLKNTTQKYLGLSGAPYKRLLYLMWKKPDGFAGAAMSMLDWFL